MNSKTNLQVPISVTLKAQAEEVAEKQGFSSLQEVVRVFITNYTSGNISVLFGNSISPQVLEIYEKDLKLTKEAIAKNDVKIHMTANDAINHLSSL